jgi:HAD superfamily hydrolase (TIGR01484 family)
MSPLSQFCLKDRSDIRVLLLDIDDTLTTHGQVTAAAYSAVERLKRAGFIVAAITGRPAGWCDHIARMWPVDGVVGENGAFYFRYDAANKKLVQRFLSTDVERAATKKQLSGIAEKILREVAGTALASDQAYREADIAIDFCEDVAPLPHAEILRIKQIMEAAGMTAKISSIHVNGWFGAYDKLSTTKIFMREVFNINLDERKNEFVFIGDSPNDAPMFSYFPHSVGVANVNDFPDSLLLHRPAYVTAARSGDGFIELADALLSARRIGL